jgi:hypothetical protein
MSQSPPPSPHPTLLTASLILCEKALAEEGGILSAIRIADTFSYVREDVEPGHERYIRFYVISSVRLKPQDESSHAIELNLVRPDGTSEVVAHATQSPPPITERKFPELPTGINLMGELPIRVAQLGTHYLYLLLDGTEAAKALFHIMELDSPPTKQ